MKIEDVFRKLNEAAYDVPVQPPIEVAPEPILKRTPLTMSPDDLAKLPAALERFRTAKANYPVEIRAYHRVAEETRNKLKDDLATVYGLPPRLHDYVWLMSNRDFSKWLPRHVIGCYAVEAEKVTAILNLAAA